jgi:hypothetical protein
MIQPETLYSVELRDHLAHILLKERRLLNVRLSDPQAFPVISQRQVRHSPSNRCECGRRRLKDFEITRLKSSLPELVHQLKQIWRIDID